MTALLPGRRDYAGLRRSWPRDLLAGLTVGIVALPLALAFGVASGVGPAVGLVTAVVAGAVAAVCGGSHLQVTGPTGAMTVVLIPLVAGHGAGVVYPLAVLAGVLLLAGAVARLGGLLAYVPWPLIEGFTVGIAVVIAAQEVPAALGVTKPEVQNAFAAAVVAIGRFATHPHWPTLGLLALTVAVAATLPRLHRSIPAGLLAIVVVSLVASLGHLDVTRLGQLPSGLPAPSLPSFAGLAGLVGPALVVAFLAALESLLSAQVADGMSDRPRSDPNRELFGQGLANIASGLFGGLPATGAIARTAVNARAGAQTRLAALTHAAVLALVVYAASALVGRIPMVALAGVLLVTAGRMIDRHTVRAVLTSTRGDAAVFVVTAVGTVAFDLVTAVAAGLALAGLLALRTVAGTVRVLSEPVALDGVDADTEHDLLRRHVLVYRVDGPLFFAAAARFLTEVAATTEVRVVILRLRAVAVLDATGARALGTIVADLRARHITVLVKGASAAHRRLLTRVGALDDVLARGHLFDDLPTAVAHAATHVEGAGCAPVSQRGL